MSSDGDGVSDISVRLQQERRRLGLDKSAAASLAGVHASTYLRWEGGVPPPSDRLRALAEAGFDIQYVITGVRLPDGIREEMEAYAADPKERAMAALDLVLEVAGEFGVRDRLTAEQTKQLLGYAYEWAPTRESLRAFFRTAIAAGLGSVGVPGK